MPWFRSSFRVLGGTALAEYYLGHRISDDIDLFTIDPGQVREGAKRVADLAESEAELDIVAVRSDPLQWSFSVSRRDGREETRVDITTADTPFRDAPVEVDGISIASLHDIVIGKMLAASDRTEGKDAVDLWAIENIAGLRLNDVARELSSRDPRFLVSPDRWARTLHRLAEALPDLEIPDVIVKINRQDLKNFFEQSATDAVKAILP